jgi:hypothetical protein
MEDIERRYGGTLNLNELFNCLEYLYKNLVKAAVYLRAGAPLKARYVKAWKVEPGEG